MYVLAFAKVKNSSSSLDSHHNNNKGTYGKENVLQLARMFYLYIQPAKKISLLFISENWVSAQFHKCVIGFSLWRTLIFFRKKNWYKKQANPHAVHEFSEQNPYALELGGSGWPMDTLKVPTIRQMGAARKFPIARHFHCTHIRLNALFPRQLDPVLKGKIVVIRNPTFGSLQETRLNQILTRESFT